MKIFSLIAFLVLAPTFAQTIDPAIKAQFNHRKSNSRIIPAAVAYKAAVKNCRIHQEKQVLISAGYTSLKQLQNYISDLKNKNVPVDPRLMMLVQAVNSRSPEECLDVREAESILHEAKKLDFYVALLASQSECHDQNFKFADYDTSDPKNDAYIHARGEACVNQSPTFIVGKMEGDYSNLNICYDTKTGLVSKRTAYNLSADSCTPI